MAETPAVDLDAIRARHQIEGYIPEERLIGVVEAGCSTCQSVYNCDALDLLGMVDTLTAALAYIASAADCSICESDPRVCSRHQTPHVVAAAVLAGTSPTPPTRDLAALQGLARAAVYYTGQTGWGPLNLDDGRCLHCGADMQTEEHKPACRYATLWAFMEDAMVAMPELIDSMTNPPKLRAALGVPRTAGHKEDPARTATPRVGGPDCLRCERERVEQLPVGAWVFYHVQANMIVCRECGDKRCAKAADHREACDHVPVGGAPTTEPERPLMAHLQDALDRAKAGAAEAEATAGDCRRVEHDKAPGSGIKAWCSTHAQPWEWCPAADPDTTGGGDA